MIEWMIDVTLSNLLRVMEKKLRVPSQVETLQENPGFLWKSFQLSWPERGRLNGRRIMVLFTATQSLKLDGDVPVSAQ